MRMNSASDSTWIQKLEELDICERFLVAHIK